MFSLHSRYLFSVVVLLAFLGRLSDGKKVHVRMVNELKNGLDLNVHCKSGDDDLGPHLLHSNEIYEFSFGRQLFGRTLFFCRFWWGNEAHWFDIYDDSRDNQRCYLSCSWLVKETGPCLFNQYNGEYDLCADWNKEQLLQGGGGSTREYLESIEN